MPIVTRRQSMQQSSQSASADANRRATLAPKSIKDSNLLVDIAAPLDMNAFASPFKRMGRRVGVTRSKLTSLSHKVAALAQATAQTGTGGPADKENQYTHDHSDQLDDSDRMWVELNKPTVVAEVVHEATPQPPRRYGLRSSLKPVTPSVSKIPATLTETYTSQLNDVEPTPYKLIGTLTPGRVPSSAIGSRTNRRRRSSTRGDVLKMNVDETEAETAEDESLASTISPSSASHMDDSFTFGSSQIGDTFDGASFDDSVESFASLTSDRKSILPQSFTPSKYGRTRSSAAMTPILLANKPDRRSLHHTQLLLLKQLVEDALTL